MLILKLLPWKEHFFQQITIWGLFRRSRYLYFVFLSKLAEFEVTLKLFLYFFVFALRQLFTMSFRWVGLTGSSRGLLLSQRSTDSRQPLLADDDMELLQTQQSQRSQSSQVDSSLLLERGGSSDIARELREKPSSLRSLDFDGEDLVDIDLVSAGLEQDGDILQQLVASQSESQAISQSLSQPRASPSHLRSTEALFTADSSLLVRYFDWFYTICSWLALLALVFSVISMCLQCIFLFETITIATAVI